MKKTFIILASLALLGSCGGNGFEHDASGTFEATEVIVSAESAGKLEQFTVEEGDLLQHGQQVGFVDSTQLYLKKLQLEASRKAVDVSRPNIGVQISATKEQIAKAETEQRRLENLVGAGAAPRKQLDDAESQLRVLRQTLSAQVNSLSTSVGSLSEQSASLEIQIAQVQDLLDKCRIVNPIGGRVLNKYSQEKEIVIQGKPLYKIADTENLFLRAYIVSAQLEKVTLGSSATVYADGKSYLGKVVWISDKAEFTPKTIQTKDERQNLVYGVKVAVSNPDGDIKIGMYGDVDFGR